MHTATVFFLAFFLINLQFFGTIGKTDNIRVFKVFQVWICYIFFAFVFVFVYKQVSP